MLTPADAPTKEGVKEGVEHARGAANAKIGEKAAQADQVNADKHRKAAGVASAAGAANAARKP